MAIRETYVPISDATPIVLVDPATGDYYTLKATVGGFTINRINGVPVSNALPVVLVDPTNASGQFYRPTSGSGTGFADQGRETITAGAVEKDVTFAVTGTDPIPIILYTTWPSGAYIEPGSISTTGMTVIFPVECPVGGGELAWAYVEA